MTVIKNMLFGFLLMFSLFGVISMNSAPVYADEDVSCDLNKSFLGIPTWYKYLNATEDSSGRCSPQLTKDSEGNEINSVLPIGLAILEAMLRLSSVVAVVMIFVAGFKFITSQGSPDNAAAARKTAINALIGLVIVVIATGFVSFIGNSLAGT